MLRYNDKKIDAAFKRLRDKRKAVGLESRRKMTPEEEAENLKRDMQAAAAANDISTVMSLMIQASSQTTDDFVDKILGGIRFMYYSFVDKFHTRPIDLEDLVDGILYTDAYNYIEKKERDRIMKKK